MVFACEPCFSHWLTVCAVSLLPYLELCAVNFYLFGRLWAWPIVKSINDRWKLISINLTMSCFNLSDLKNKLHLSIYTYIMYIPVYLIRITVYYTDMSVLLENTPLVKFIWNHIRDSSGVFSISSLVKISMISLISSLSLKLYLNSLVYDRNIFGSSSKVFGNLW